MSDPKRLLDEGADDLGTTLLRAGRTLDDEQARQRKLALLGAGAMLGAAGASASRGGLFQGLLTKWVGLGLMTTVLVAGLAAKLLASPEHPITPTVRTVLAAHPIATGEAARAENAAPAAVLAPPTDRPTPGIAIDSLPSTDSTDAPTVASKPSAGKTAEPTEASTLADEVASLREAREALAQGQATRALTALDAYQRRFPGGHLGLEAEELRIEALARSGNGAAAQARARAFLTAHPSSPYAHRLKALAFPGGDEPAKTP